MSRIMNLLATKLSSMLRGDLSNFVFLVLIKPRILQNLLKADFFITYLKASSSFAMSLMYVFWP